MVPKQNSWTLNLSSPWCVDLENLTENVIYNPVIQGSQWISYLCYNNEVLQIQFAQEFATATATAC